MEMDIPDTNALGTSFAIGLVIVIFVYLLIRIFRAKGAMKRLNRDSDEAFAEMLQTRRRLLQQQRKNRKIREREEREYKARQDQTIQNENQLERAVRLRSPRLFVAALIGERQAKEQDQTIQTPPTHRK